MPNLQYEYTDHYDQMDPVATEDTCESCFEADPDVPHSARCIADQIADIDDDMLQNARA